MMGTARRNWWALAIAAVVAAAAACAAPTLPTPPPVAQVSLVGDTAIVIGTAEPTALVACYNEDTGRGVIETADGNGRFEIRIGAQQGHELTLWQIVGNSPGQLETLVVPAASP